MIPLELEPGSDSWEYEKLTWCERKERTARDYGPPEVSTKPEDWAKFEDLERNKEHMLSAIIF